MREEPKLVLQKQGYGVASAARREQAAAAGRGVVGEHVGVKLCRLAGAVLVVPHA